MSKNCELFINLCNFMKYLLNEILPEQDPTDSVKDAAQDILSAIITYSKKINYELTPVFNCSCSEGNASCKNGEHCGTPSPVKERVRKEKHLQVTHLSPISFTDQDRVGQNFHKDGLISSSSPATDQGAIKSRKNSKEKSVQSLKNNLHNFVDLGKMSVSKKVRKSQVDKVPLADIKIKPHCSNTEMCQKYCRKEHVPLETNEDSKPDKTESTSCIGLDKVGEDLEGGVSSGNPFRRVSDKSSKDNIRILTKHNSYTKPILNRNGAKQKKATPVDESNMVSCENFEIFFEKNFLKFYSFSDTKSETTNSLDESSDTNCDESSLSDFDDSGTQSIDTAFLDKLLSLKISEKKMFSLKREPDVIPYSFQAINGCLVSKLINHGLYCWKCQTTVDSYIELEEHFQMWDLHGIPLKDEIRAISNLCDDCEFIAIAPNSKMNQLKEFHNQYHKSNREKLLPSNHSSPEKEISKENKAVANAPFDYVPYINKMLKDKILRERSSRIYSFLGICLNCKSSFLSPLEWYYHIHEFQHLLSANEQYVSCGPCCLVILGKRDQNIENFMSLPLHSNHCIGTLGEKYSSHWDIDI